MNDDLISLSVNIDSDTKIINNIISACEQLGSMVNYNDSVIRTTLPLVLDELLRNSIVHGNGSDCTKKIHVKIVFDIYYVYVMVKDEGKGFDFHHFLDENYTTESSFRGRGIMIVKNYADSLEYSDNGSRVNLKIKAGK